MNIITSVSTTKSNVFSAALLTAAMSLPSLQFASAEAAPERGVVSFKYLNYQDKQNSGSSSQSGSTQSGGEHHEGHDDHFIVISGASTAGTSTTSGGSNQDRISINAYSVSALTPIAGVWSLGLTYTSDSVSGASPAYHTSGLTTMNDLRRAVDAQLTRYFSKGTLSAGISHSSESDYVSRSYSLQGSLSTEDKNTTFTLGGSLTDDSINPNNRKVVDEKKQVNAGLAGITRILSKNDIVQLNLGYSHGNGYFTDPYKNIDNRPRDRNNTTVLTRWNHHFDNTDGTAHFSYRYYSDTFGIRAHTLGAEYVQPLRNGWTVTPLLRLYSQSEADFYVAVGAAEKADPTIATPPPVNAVYYTEDQRMSAFGALTLGLKVSKQLNPDWLVDVKYEQYEQRSNWCINGTGDSGLADFGARSIQVGVSRQF
jgi:hypothetical protein